MCIIHRWSEWKLKTYSKGAYDQEIWEERYCIKCGKIQQRGVINKQEKEGNMARRTSALEDISFRELLRDNLETLEIDATGILDWVGENFLPEDIFDNEKLAEWAESNGFVQSQDEEGVG